MNRTETTQEISPVAAGLALAALGASEPVVALTHTAVAASEHGIGDVVSQIHI